MASKGYKLTGSPVFRDPVAAAIWQARVGATTVPPEITAEPLDVTRGRAIANELYDALESAGHVRDGWKLVPFLLPDDMGFNPGGTDEATGETWGRGAPFGAPIYRDFCPASPCTLSLSDFVDPIIEMEVGITLKGDRVVGAMACVDINDCRCHPEWKPSFPLLVADFLTAAVMIYGDRLVPAAQLGARPLVPATLTRDGEVVQSFDLAVTDAIHRATAVRPERPVAGPARVATGAVVNAPHLEPGAWRADFGFLGAIDIVVTV
jgi:2-keto-4-pentenoate hydratase